MPGMIPPNTLPYGIPPPPLNPSYSQRGTFVSQQQVNPAMSMMPPANGYFQPPVQNFMQPPPTLEQTAQHPNFPPMPLSALTPVMPDKLTPLKGSGSNLKLQRYRMFQKNFWSYYGSRGGGSKIEIFL